MRRLHCTDAACLKRSAETIAPACAALLLGSPEPSPEPAPETASRTMSVRREQAGGSTGFFSITTSSSDGQMRRVSGPIGLAQLFDAPSARSAVLSARPSESRMPPTVAMLHSFLPPDIVAMLSASGLDIGGGPMAVMQLDNEDDDEPSGPCDREYNACMLETRSRSGAALTACLVHHLHELSPPCRCHVEQLTRGRYTTSPGGAAVAMAPSVRTVPMPPPAAVTVVEPTIVHVERGPTPESMTPTAPHHHLACLLIFTTLFVLAFLLARACIQLLCCGSRARRVVVVPPGEARIATVGPVLAAEIVQVAEPASKSTTKA